MKNIIVLVIIFSLFCTVVLAQKHSLRDNNLEAKRFFGSPMFLYNIYFFMCSSDKSMTVTELHLGFCNDILQFIKKTNKHFEAKYEVVIAIFDKKGNHTGGKTISDEIIVATFPETNFREISNRISHIVELVPGEYKFIIELTDLDTRKTLRREKKIKIPCFHVTGIGISDIIFTNDIEDSNSIIPNLNRNFKDHGSNFGAYCEIYPISLKDQLTIKYRIIDAVNKIAVNKEKTFLPSNLIIPFKINLKDQISRSSRYTLEIEVEQKDIIANTDGKFSTSWNHFDAKKLNIQQALAPMENLINSKNWKWLQQVSDSVKEVWLDNYWKERDPTPETKNNELMDEFYERVDFANYHFTVNTLDKDGWKTDRGNVYVKYGKPTSVDRHTDEINIPPYEIWYYSSIDRRFIFEDRSGIGDYNLVKIE